MNFFRLAKRVIAAIYARYLIFVDPERYARYMGVNLGKRVKFYGVSSGMFGSEPWLITIGNNVHVVSGCSFITHDGGVLILRDKYPTLELTKPIVIGSNVYLGMNCMLLPGVTIGDNVIVGAGSIVTRSVPSNCVVAGVPARFIKTLDDYAAKANKDSLELGHLSAVDKDQALRRLYGHSAN